MKYAAKLISIFIGMSLSVLSIAEDAYICRYGDSIREIHVVYDTPGAALPCSVLYRKAEGEQVLWTAENMAGYCEERARSFMEQQRSWGWECSSETSSSEPGLSEEEMSAEPVDTDTEMPESSM